MGVNIVARLLGLDEDHNPAVEKKESKLKPRVERVTEKWRTQPIEDEEETRVEDEPE